MRGRRDRGRARRRGAPGGPAARGRRGLRPAAGAARGLRARRGPGGRRASSPPRSPAATPRASTRSTTRAARRPTAAASSRSRCGARWRGPPRERARRRRPSATPSTSSGRGCCTPAWCARRSRPARVTAIDASGVPADVVALLPDDVARPRRATAASSATRTSCRRASCATSASRWPPWRAATERAARGSGRRSSCVDYDELPGVYEPEDALAEGAPLRARPRRPGARERPAPRRRQQRLPPLPAAARPRRGRPRRGRRRRRGRVDVRRRAARADGAARLHGRVDGRAADGVDGHADAVQRARGARRRVRPRPARRARDRAADGRQLRRQDVLPAGADRRRARAQGRPAGAGRARPRRGLRHAQPPPRALPRAARRARATARSWGGACGPGGTPARTPTPARTSPRRAAGRPSGPYRFDHVEVDSLCVYTHRPPAGAYRGYAATQAVWAAEQCVDLLAERLGIDPLELRLRNVLRDGEAFCTGEVLHDFRVAECLEDVAERIGWRAGPARQGPLRADEGHADAEPLRGRASSSSTAPSSSRSATTEIGQGAVVALPALAAAALGVERDAVTMGPVDTDLVALRHAHDVEPLDAHDGRRARPAPPRSCGPRIAEELEAAPGDLVLAEGHASRARRAGAARARWPTSGRCAARAPGASTAGSTPTRGRASRQRALAPGRRRGRGARGRRDGPRRGRAPRGRRLRRAGRRPRARGAAERRLAGDGRSAARSSSRSTSPAARSRTPTSPTTPSRPSPTCRRSTRRCWSARARRCTGSARPRCRSCPPPSATRCARSGCRRRTCRCTPEAVLRRRSTRATGRRREDRRRAQRRGGGAGGRRRGAAARRAARARACASVRPTCGIGVCGACTVLVDDEPISSCLLLAPLAAGRRADDARGARRTTPCSRPSTGSAPTSAGTVRPA